MNVVPENDPMRAVWSLVVAVLAFVVFAAPSVVLADGRVALVVGNGTYAHIGPLPNSANDAAAWRVTEGTALSRWEGTDAGDQGRRS